MKRQICLYLDADAVSILKSKGENISSFVNDMVTVEAGMTKTDKDNEITQLRLALTKHQQIIRDKDKEISKLKKEIETKENQIIKPTESYQL